MPGVTEVETRKWWWCKNSFFFFNFSASEYVCRFANCCRENSVRSFLYNQNLLRCDRKYNLLFTL